MNGRWDEWRLRVAVGMQRGCVRSGSGIAHGGLLTRRTPGVTRINNFYFCINSFAVAYLQIYPTIRGFISNQYFVKLAITNRRLVNYLISMARKLENPE
jgi:hypothetical protein